MKSKKLNKPLGLNKQTVANLESEDLSKAKGGACTYPPTGCDSIIKDCLSTFPSICDPCVDTFLC